LGGFFGLGVGVGFRGVFLTFFAFWWRFGFAGCFYLYFSCFWLFSGLFSVGFGDVFVFPVPAVGGTFFAPFCPAVSGIFPFLLGFLWGLLAGGAAWRKWGEKRTHYAKRSSPPTCAKPLVGI